MDIEAARARCRELLGLGLSTYKAGKILEAEILDPDILAQAIEEYKAMHKADQASKKRFWQIAGPALFLGSGGLFIYFVFFAYTGSSLFVFPLLGLAVWGLFKASLP